MEKGPGYELFRTIEEKLGKVSIIAEDLGFLTPEVIQMVKDTGYPGMKVLQFAFDPRDTGSGYLPHLYTNNSVVYPGTHDNETIMGWMDDAPEGFADHAIEYMHLDKKKVITGALSAVLMAAYLILRSFRCRIFLA